MRNILYGAGILAAHTRTLHRYTHCTNEFSKNLFLFVFHVFYVVNHHELKLNELIKFIFPVPANYYSVPQKHSKEWKRERERAHACMHYSGSCSFVILYL